MIKKLMNNHFLMNVYIVLIFLLPNGVIYYGVMYFFLLILLQIKILNKNSKIVLLISVFLSFIFNINSFYEFKDLLIAFNIVFLLFFFPFFFKKVQIKIYVIYFITIIVLLSQLSFLFQIQPLMNLFETIYKNENLENEFTSFITGALRNGGLYYNPNQASKYLTSILTLLLVLDYKNRDKLIIATSILFSVFLTGSRTGLVIALIILLCYTLFIIRRKIISFFLIVFGSISVIIIGEGSRSLNLGETGSFDYKLNAFINYWNIITKDENFLNLLFGNFTTNYSFLFQKYRLDSFFRYGFDAEIGMMISSLGLFFTILYLIYYINIFKWINKSNFIILIPFFIWPLTSTILFSIKTSIVYFSILGIVIFNSNKNLEQTSKMKV